MSNSKKNGLKRGSEQWKQEQFKRYMKKVTDTSAYDEDILDKMYQEIELMKNAKARIDERNNNN